MVQPLCKRICLAIQYSSGAAVISFMSGYYNNDVASSQTRQTCVADVQVLQSSLTDVIKVKPKPLWTHLTTAQYVSL